MTDLSPLLDLATSVIRAAEAKKLKIATAESCTGGLVAGALTEVAGSSAVVERGFVTYANAAKTGMLGVDVGLIERVGAVSEEVARAMAEGALRHAPVDIAVAVTGIAGPGGGSPAKPVGLVHFAAVRRGMPTVHERHVFTDPGRSAIRFDAVRAALGLIHKMIQVR
jgi:nicotinamide-nucleotide amidase